MNILAIDTSSTSGSIALAKNNTIVYCTYLDIKKTHSERLMLQIKETLIQNKLALSDIDAVCLANGPGSFTGIRIGLATAKGLCFGSKTALLPQNNLRLLASNIYGNSRSILSFIDAKMGEVYTALYTSDLKEIIPPRNCSPEAILSLIDQPITIIGSGATIYKTQIEKSGIDFDTVLPHQELNLATACISLALLDDVNPIYSFDKIADLEPFYLRKSQAEINKEKGD